MGQTTLFYYFELVAKFGTHQVMQSLPWAINPYTISDWNNINFLLGTWLWGPRNNLLSLKIDGNWFLKWHI